MLQLCYISRAADDLDHAALQNILSMARAKNQQLEITGLLLYKKGTFMQVLEGPESSLEGLFSVINQDPRHHSVSILYRVEAEDREFPDWSMGFFQLDPTIYDRAKGMSDFLSPDADLTAFSAGEATRAKKMLLLFRKI